MLVVTGVNRLHARIDLPEFYGNAINAFVATLLAGGAYALGAAGVLGLSARDFAFIVAGGIVAMLPGRTMASAIEDVLFGFPLTGAGRLLSVFLSLTGLIIGIATGLSVLLSITEMTDGSFVSPSVLDLSTDQAAHRSPPSAVRWSSGSPAPSRCRAWVASSCRSGLLSVMAASVYALLNRSFGVGPIMASGVAAVVLGVAGGSARAPGAACPRWCSSCPPASRCCPV